MIVVQQAALFVGQLVVPLVVAVMGDQADFLLPETGFQAQGKGGLAAARAARNADDKTVHEWFLPARSGAAGRFVVYCWQRLWRNVKPLSILFIIIPQNALF